MKKAFLFFALVMLLAVFVWPTRYKQYAPGEGPYAPHVSPEAPTRENRLTGEVWVQEPSGEWRSIGNARKALAFEKPAVDPNATRRPSAEYNQGVVDQSRRSVEQTEKAAETATQQRKE